MDVNVCNECKTESFDYMVTLVSRDANDDYILNNF